MDDSDRVSSEDCPNCGTPATVGWTEGDLNEIDCRNGCGRPWRTARTAHRAASRDRDAIARGEVMVALFERAILDTAATYGLTDLRTAASLVADAWTDVLSKEGRPPRLVESASAAVRKIGDGLHRRQN
jgi:hypothetical protein